MELVQLLHCAGADLNLRDSDGDTPLHVCELPEVAEYLILNGADPLATNYQGDTIFDKAEEDENEAMIEYWMSKGLGNRGPNNPGPNAEQDWEAFNEEDENEDEGDDNDNCEDIE